jgi:hypothetical protein
MPRILPISEQIRIAKFGTRAQFHRFVVATAKREHAEIMSTAPKPGGFTRYVDGVRGAREEKVRATGIIIYEYDRIEVVVQFAMDTLFDKSPVLSGEYRSAHTIFINGVPATSLKTWQSGDDLAISNITPYARKIEVGTMTMTVPGTDHVYQQAVQIIKARYGNMARVAFSYRNIAIAEGAAATRYPALIISEN